MSDCSHKELKKQLVGKRFWYACTNCPAKFKTELWDGKVQVTQPAMSEYDKWWAANAKDLMWKNRSYGYIAKAAWQARGASEYERGRRDFVAEIEKLKRITPSELDAEEQWRCNGEYVNLDEVLSLLAATSGTPAPHPAMLALESLTPGGSEYVGDIKRCVETVRETRRMQMAQIVKLTKRVHELEASAAPAAPASGTEGRE